MEFTVTYYDPLWSLLWGEKNGEGFFLPVRGRALPMRSGQRVRLDGKVTPAQGFATDDITVTVLANEQWPAALPLNGHLDEISRFDTRWSNLEGYVFGQREVGPTHLELQVNFEGLLAKVNILIGENSPVPQLMGARVRLRGTCVVIHDSAGAKARIDFWVPRLADVEVVGWLADDNRFKLPRTLIDRLGVGSKSDALMIMGEVFAQEPGKSLTVRDETGQLFIQTSQPGLLAAGSRVRVVGQPATVSGQMTLLDPLFQSVGDAGPPLNQVPAGLAKLRLADQVLSLSPVEADKHQPVGLRGVVTWSNEKAPFFYLQDASGGVCVYHHLDGSQVPIIGSDLIVTGETVRGNYAPAINLEKATLQGLLILPPARALTLGQAMMGANDGRWVELRGYVSQVVPKQDGTVVHLTNSSGDFVAEVPGAGALTELLGTTVRVTGVCTAMTNDRRELVGVRLLLPDREAITVEIPATDIFSVPVQSVASLRQFSGQQAFTRMIHLVGTVMFHMPGQYLYLQDETGGMKILAKEGKAWQPGSLVEVAGFPGLDGGRTLVREAIIRSVKSGEKGGLPPRFLHGVHGIDPVNEATLVRLVANLHHSVVEGSGYRLTLQAAGMIFDARLRAGQDWEPPAPDTLLSLTGVYVIEYDEYHQPSRFFLELRAPGDILVLETPSWWNVRRAITLAGVFALCAMLISAWVFTLRRRVEFQTKQIQRQHEKEARLQSELERSLRLESLGLLASGIAQEFDGQLTTILSNLGLAARDKRVTDAAGDCITEAERGARRIRDLTQQLKTFAKGGDPVRTVVHLPEVVTEAASFALHDTGIQLDFSVPANLPPAFADAGQISRVVYNLVTFAIQRAPQGEVVKLTLEAVAVAKDEVDTLAPGRYVQLSIACAGQSLSPATIAGIFDPYYCAEGESGDLGLASARAILKKHDGHIEASPLIPTGLAFRFWLPVFDKSIPGTVTMRQSRNLSRILVLSAEKSTLDTLSRLLALASHEVTGVPNLAEAIAANAKAAESGRPFDWVIMDLEPDGRNAASQSLAELRRVNAGLRAVAVSENTSTGVGREPIALGFQVIVSKPYDISELLRAIG